jgi:hypothetical protein
MKSNSLNTISILTIYLVLTGTLLLTGKLSAEQSDEDIIRSVRAISNQAIKDRDIDALKNTWLANLHVTSSSGAVIQDGDQMATLFREAFTDSKFIIYVRTPVEVNLSPGNMYAAERGGWISRRNSKSGEMVVEGTYLAQWHKVETGWRIRSEVFIALSCVGSKECENLP